MIVRNLIFIATVILVTACAQNKNIYYWADYSNTLYAAKKEKSVQSDERHYAELQKIISLADHFKKKIPPGIYFELSMYESKKGNHDRANFLLSKEYSLYPEAKTYVDNMKAGYKDE